MHSNHRLNFHWKHDSFKYKYNRQNMEPQKSVYYNLSKMA